MARTVKYDVSGEDPAKTGGAMPLPKKGWYKAKIDKVTFRKGKGDYEFQVVITDKKAKGFRLWDYIDFGNDNVRWKVAQFLEAIGEVSKAKSGKAWKKAKGKLDPEETVGTKVAVRVKHSSYEGEPTAKLGGWGSVDSLAKAKDEDDEPDEDEDEDVEEDEEDEEAEEEDEDEDGSDDEGDDEDEEDDEDEDDDEEQEEDDGDDEDEGDEDADEEDDEEEPAPRKRAAKRKPVAKKAAKKSAKKASAKKGKVKRAKGDLPF